MSGLGSVLLLVLSNIFMTLAWYGHLQLHKSERWSTLPLYAVGFAFLVLAVFFIFEKF